jgi:protein gp37
MADGSHIEWTDATWNPITGCSVVSPGCTNCYAMKLAGTRLKYTASRQGLTIDTKAGPAWNGQVRLNEGWIDQPLSWRRRRRIFVCAHGDLFHESVPDAWIDKVFARMAIAGQHTYQVLTKRSARMRAYLTAPDVQSRIATEMMQAAPIGRLLTNPIILQPGKGTSISAWPLPNVWLGVSVEDERTALRVLDLLDSPTVIRFVSYEPALEWVDFRSICNGHYFVDALAGLKYHDAPEGVHSATAPHAHLNQIIMGGESGPGARPMHPRWVSWTRDACAATDVAFFFKQWGAWAACPSNDGGHWPTNAPGHLRLAIDGERRDDGWPMQLVGKKAAGRLLDGVLHDAMPEVRA